MNRAQTAERVRISIIARDSANAGVTGDTVTLSIRKDSDGTWWNGTGFQVSHSSVTMSETNAANMPGVYHYDFTPTGTDFACAYYATCASGSVVNDPIVGAVKFGYWVDDIDASIASRSSEETLTKILKRLGNVLLDKDIMNLQKVIADGFNKVLGRMKQ